MLIGDVLTQLEELTSLVADMAELARGDLPAVTAEPLRLDQLVQDRRGGGHHPRPQPRRHFEA